MYTLYTFITVSYLTRLFQVPLFILQVKSRLYDNAAMMVVFKIQDSNLQSTQTTVYRSPLSCVYYNGNSTPNRNRTCVTVK